MKKLEVILLTSEVCKPVHVPIDCYITSPAHAEKRRTQNLNYRKGGFMNESECAFIL